MFNEFKEKFALVTGTSKGIGLATAKGLLESGCSVVGLARGESVLTKQYPSLFTQLQTDLGNTSDIDKAFKKINSITKTLDYIVNVAGMDPKVSIEDSNDEQWHQIMDLNLKGYYFVIKHSLPLLKVGSGKSIVNISSINYRIGVKGRSIYSASKAGILGLTTGLSRELGAYGIRINTVTPGWTFTERQVEEYFNTGNKNNDDKFLQELKEKQSLDIHIMPKDIANHILFYLSSLSKASTGHNCVVDGGWLLE